MEGWPEHTWPEICEKCSNDAEFKLVFRGARTLKKMQGVGKQNFNPPSSLFQSRTRCQMIFSDLAFVTETELQKLLGNDIGGKALKLKEGEIPLEDRPGSLKGYYMSMAGLPLDFLFSCRKVRTSYGRDVVHTEHRLRPETQIYQQQGDGLFTFFSQKHAEATDSAARTINRSKVYTFSTLRKRADEILQDWCRKGRGLHSGCYGLRDCLNKKAYDAKTKTEAASLHMDLFSGQPCKVNSCY